MIRNPDRRKFYEALEQLPEKPPKITIGENTYIHPSTTIGESGITVERDKQGNFIRYRNHGDIIIGDDVEIGAHCDIKRATMPDEATTIGKGSILCTFVNVGHNCKIGRNVFIGPHVCLNGTVKIHDNAWVGGHAVIHQHVTIGENAIVGIGAIVRNDVAPKDIVVNPQGVATSIQYVGNYVHPSFKHGKNLKMGKYNYIHEGVVVGDNCTIRSYAELRKGTIIGDDCYIDSGVKSSGKCKIGNRVTIRYESIIARGVEVADDVFLSPQLMTENVSHRGEQVGGAKIGLGEWEGKTEYRVFIGTNVTLAARVEICPGTIIGSKTNVRKSITEPGVYVGNPARRLR